MTSFNDNHSSSNLPDSLHNIVKSVFEKIENASDVNVQYGRGKYGDFVSVTMDKEDHIYLDLSLTKDCVDLILGKSKSPYYEMAEIIHENDIREFENLLERLLQSELKELWYKSGSVLIIDVKNNDTILKVSSMLSFFMPKRIVKELVYKPWI